MSLKVRFRFEGKCNTHPRYDPAKEGASKAHNCQSCEDLYVVWLYVRIAARRAKDAFGQNPLRSSKEAE